MTQYDMEHYTWLVVLGACASFFAAFGIGANDVANAFATSVGSKALTIKQACVIAVVMEFVGATFLGAEVVKTIRKGIADENVFVDNPPLLMYGCLCVIISVGTWLLIACRLEMPVSTTHSCVGGMIGMTIAARGANSVKWYIDPSPPDSPLPGGLLGVVLSWFISPLCSGLLAMMFFYIVRRILRSKAPFRNSVRVYPALVFFCVTIISLFMLTKGLNSFEAIETIGMGVKVGSSLGVGAMIAICALPLYSKCKKRIETGKFHVASPSIEMTNTTSTVEVQENTTCILRLRNSLMSSLNQNVHSAVLEDESTLQVHRNAEVFDKNSEAMFMYLQVFTACFDALAHGANDVANAVGPFATIFLIYNGGEIGSKQDMGEHRYWILGLGGVGIGLGLLLYGSQILRAMGVKLAVITPSRGFCIELGSSTIVIIGAYYGLPLSTTHCQVGATVGVALLEGTKGFNKKVLLKTAFGWIFTCIFVGLMAGILTAWGAYAPSARHECESVN